MSADIAAAIVRGGNEEEEEEFRREGVDGFSHGELTIGRGLRFEFFADRAEEKSDE